MRSNKMIRLTTLAIGFLILIFILSFANGHRDYIDFIITVPLVITLAATWDYAFKDLYKIK
jgi:hypothetical protein